MSSMLRSFFSGGSSARNHQARLDVIGHAVTHVNSVAATDGRATFARSLAQLLPRTSCPPGYQGSINPIQIALGVPVELAGNRFTEESSETGAPKSGPAI